MYVVAEGIIICDMSSKKISDALVILLAPYFLYNIEYSKISKNIFNFYLEMALSICVVSEKSPVSVTTFMNVLSN
jgi:hypothetical protein